MFHRTALSSRSAVAFFNMKTFHGRYKTAVEPGTVHNIFSTQVMPNDRLMQQSRAGAGAARVLLINSRQMVKGVYSPLLCMTHPSLVPGGDSPLGVTVESYLAAIGPAPSGKSTKRAKEETPSVMVTVSHPNGLAICSYSANGTPNFQVRNICFDPLVASTGETAGEAAAVAPATPSAASQLQEGMGAASAEIIASVRVPDPVLDELVDTMNGLYDKHLAACSTFYFVTHDRASITLDALRRAFRARDDSAPKSRVALDDRRWVAMPELALQGGHKSAPLYARDATTRSKIVNPAGLTAAVCRGQLELDYVPKDPSELTPKGAQTAPPSGSNGAGAPRS